MSAVAESNLRGPEEAAKNSASRLGAAAGKAEREDGAARRCVGA
jgi:hypothetical protein